MSPTHKTSSTILPFFWLQFNMLNFLHFCAHCKISADRNHVLCAPKRWVYPEQKWNSETQLYFWNWGSLDIRIMENNSTYQLEGFFLNVSVNKKVEEHNQKQNKERKLVLLPVGTSYSLMIWGFSFDECCVVWRCPWIFKFSGQLRNSCITLWVIPSV